MKLFGWISDLRKKFDAMTKRLEDAKCEERRAFSEMRAAIDSGRCRPDDMVTALDQVTQNVSRRPTRFKEKK